MKQLFRGVRGWALLLWMTLAAAGAARAATGAMPDVVDGVAAVVNTKIITYSQVFDYVQPVIRQLRRNYSGKEFDEKVRAAQMDALDNLIDRELIIQDFKEKGFNIPESYVDEQLNNVIAEEFGGDRAAFIKTLTAQRMTLAQYRDQLRDRIIVQAMRTRKAQQEMVVSPYKIGKYYQEHQDDFRMDDQIKLRMIFIKKGPEGAERRTESNTNATEQASVTGTNEIVAPPPPPPADPRRKLGEEIVAKLNAGDSFDSMAKLYSEGREAKDGGGWGWIGRDVLRKELNDIAFSLKSGQHSSLIETAEGYYILQVEDVKPSHVRPMPEVRDDVEKILLEQQRTKMQEEWVKQLRVKAYIRLY